MQRQRQDATLAIVIPAFNEEEVLARTLADCAQVFADDSRLREIIVVDDASTDGTARIVEQHAAGDERIRLERNPTCVGCVPTVLRGFGLAESEFSFFLPADGQITADVARACLDKAEAGYDVVLTRRVSRQDPAHRIWMSRAYNWLVRRVLPGFPAADIDSSCLFRTALATSIDVRSPGAFGLVELVHAAQRSGARIVEIEIEHHPRQGGRAHGLRSREIVDAAKGLTRMVDIRRRHGSAHSGAR